MTIDIHEATVNLRAAKRLADEALTLYDDVNFGHSDVSIDFAKEQCDRAFVALYTAQFIFDTLDTLAHLAEGYEPEDFYYPGICRD